MSEGTIPVLSEADRLLLKERARQLALQNIAPPQINMGSWALAVSVLDERYLFPLSSVASTSKLGHCTPVPFAPQFVVGLVPDAGDLMMVADLGMLLQGRVTATAGYKIVLSSGGNRCAFAVESLEGFTPVPGDNLLQAPDNLPRRIKDLVLGVDREGRALIGPEALLRAVGVILDVVDEKT